MKYILEILLLKVQIQELCEIAKEVPIASSIFLIELGAQVQAQAKVDTQSSKNAIRIANQAKEMGTSTLVELTVQAGMFELSRNYLECRTN